MLSYRHAFHAGNHADVLKHSVLIQCLDYLRKKEKAFTYIDTHSGAGLYHLNEGYAAQNKEWLSGTGKLFDIIDEQFAPGLLQRYQEIVSPFWKSSQTYPGSAVIASQLLRSQDKAFCFELHPRDFELLYTELGTDPCFKIIRSDGPRECLSLLPPLSRRGCILIDPSYEIKSDYIDLQTHIAAIMKKFSTGTVIIWYPLLARQDALAFPASLINQYAGNRCRIELQFAEKSVGERGMYGSGLVIYNPPWTLKQTLEQDMPTVADLLKGSWFLEWKEN
jgi:23S rRNA (adenine2030-N6)-methyltransferase